MRACGVRKLGSTCKSALSLDGAEFTHPTAVAGAAAAAEDRCLVSQSLDVPVHVTVQVKTVAGNPRDAEISR
jgi:hypothetical protein